MDTAYHKRTTLQFIHTFIHDVDGNINNRHSLTYSPRNDKHETISTLSHTERFETNLYTMTELSRLQTYIYLIHAYHITRSDIHCYNVQSSNNANRYRRNYMLSFIPSFMLDQITRPSFHVSPLEPIMRNSSAVDLMHLYAGPMSTKVRTLQLIITECRLLLA